MPLLPYSSFIVVSAVNFLNLELRAIYANLQLLVSVPVTSLSEHLTADFTGVGALPSMSPHMVHCVAQFLEFLFTYQTL